MTPKKLPTEQSCENHQNNSYNYTNRNRIFNQHKQSILVKLSIDYIIITIKQKYYNSNEFNKLFKMINDNSISTRFRPTNGDEWNEIRRNIIKFNNKTHKVISLRASGVPYLPIVIKIYQPDVTLLNHMNSYLNKMEHLVSNVEFTMDFIGEEPDHIYKFMKEHLLLMWPGKKLYKPNYKTSFYGNNLREATGKGSRCYQKHIKDVDGNILKSIRVELLMKRRMFHNKEINTISDFMSMDNMIPLKYLSFKQFNFNKLHNKLIDEVGFYKIMVNDVFESFTNKIKNGDLDILNDLAKTYYKKGSLSYLQQHDFNKYFKGLVDGKVFINGDSLVVDGEKMVCTV